jgi:hypothetical protein
LKVTWVLGEVMESEAYLGRSGGEVARTCRRRVDPTKKKGCL